MPSGFAPVVRHKCKPAFFPFFQVLIFENKLLVASGLKAVGHKGKPLGHSPKLRLPEADTLQVLIGLKTCNREIHNPLCSSFARCPIACGAVLHRAFGLWRPAGTLIRKSP
jgi:hypothetical protein